MGKKLNLLQALKRSGLFDNKHDLIKAVSKGKISVGGKVTTTIRLEFNPNTRKIEYEGKLVKLQPLKYFVLNKAKNSTCQKGEETRYVVDLMNVDKKLKNSLFPVGRLDVQTRGLLIITNDGDFAHKVSSPRKRIVKTYIAETRDEVSDDQINLLKDGVMIKLDEEKDYFTLPPVEVKQLTFKKVLLSITEGKKRQVRKMLESVDNQVTNLQRVSIGDLDLNDLNINEGDWEELDGERVKKLVLGQ